ncbi:MAG: anti-sigma factor family protein [Persicimonas sp.]
MTSKCDGALKHLVDYLEGELDEQEREELEQHFSACPPCLRFLETYRNTGTICKKALEREMPAEMKKSLLVYLRVETRGGS